MEDDWSNQFNSLMNSPLGKELIRTLEEDVHKGMIQDAEQADSQEKAFGLLKQASGVILAKKHLQFRAVVPKEKGSKDN